MAKLASLNLWSLLICTGLLAGLFPTEALAKTEKLPVTASVKIASPAEPDWVQPIRNTPWTLVPANYRLVSFEDVIKQTLETDATIKISREKEIETQSRQKVVQRKRILFFFRYFSAQYLEGAAKSDVEASRWHTQSVTANALEDNLSLYFKLMRALLNGWRAYETLQQDIRQLDTTQKQFNSGDVTSLALQEARRNLLQHYGEYQDALTTYHSAARVLQTRLHLEPQSGQPALIYPAELIGTAESGFDVPSLVAFTERIPSERLGSLLRENRADLKELRSKLESLENMEKAADLKLDKTDHEVLQSSIRQLTTGLADVERVSVTSVENLFDEAQKEQQQQRLAERQNIVADTALEQTRVSLKAGFSSLNDLRQAEQAQRLARMNRTLQRLDANTVQLKLLHQTGLINQTSLLQAWNQSASAAIQP